MQPIVSIIIPVYNMEDTLKKAVESVFSIDEIPIEIIIIDDGSTDQSREIIEHLDKESSKYSSITFITKHGKNRGRGAALNQGMKLATGKYITFLDADDSIDPGEFHKMIDCVTTKESQWIIGSFATVFGNRKKIRQVDLNATPEQLLRSIAFKPVTPFHLNATFIEKEFLLSVGMFDETLLYSEDQDMKVRLLKEVSNITICDSVHYLYSKDELNRSDLLKKRIRFISFGYKMFWKNFTGWRLAAALFLHFMYDVSKLSYELIVGYRF